jgi:hypothetical protein
MKRTAADGLYLALDLGTASAKAVVIERAKGQDRLASIDEERLRPGTEFPNDLEFRSHQVQTIRRLAERLPLAEARAITAVIHHRELQTKIVDLPAMVQPSQIDSVLEWEGKKLLSPTYRSEPFLHAFQMIRSTPPTAALTVIPRSILQQIIDLYEEAGVHLTGILGEVFAGLALKSGLANPGLPAVSLVHVGQANTHLEILSAGDLRFYRHIPAGLGEGLAPPTPGEMDVFSQKIRFSFDYFRAVSKLTLIDELHFFGGGATKPGYLDFARSYFAPIKVHFLDVSGRLDISPVLTGDSARLMPYCAAIGAVLSTLENPAEGGFDFLARLRSKERARLVGVLAQTLPLWIFLLGMIAGTAFLYSLRRDALEALSEAKGTVSRLEIDISAAKLRLTKLRPQEPTSVRFTRREQAVLQPWLKQRKSGSDLLSHVAFQIPPGLALDEFLILPPGLVQQLESEAGNQAPNQENATSGSPHPPGSDEDADEPGVARSRTDQPRPSWVSILRQRSHDDTGERESEPLGGEFLVLTGTTSSLEALASLTIGLSHAGVIRRCHQVQTAPRSPGGFTFTVKGDLP